MGKSVGILELSNDLLRDILDYIEADPERSVSIDRRAYLSVESFRPPSPPPPLRAQDIGNFRLACRRFAELGVPHQYTRIATRFSPAGLQRLEKICNWQHLAKHTKKFSYLIPDFYIEGKKLHNPLWRCVNPVSGRERIRELLHHANGELNNLDASYFESKASAQRGIVKSGEDTRVLKKAMSAFRSLQHVQILRLQDEADRCLLDYIHEDEEFTQLVDLRWTPACTHATTTIGRALAFANSPFSRFSGPMMNAQSALALNGKLHKSLDFLAERLTCLELHFEDGQFFQDNMLELSGLFKRIFAPARNIQALHIGFPTRKPVNMRLEAIFNNIHWEKLRAFGVQAWRLDAEEIIGLARRHRTSLRGLRLRDVLLKEGSMWKDVLNMLRMEMELLEWVSLRRIDYSNHFDAMWSGSMEVPDYPPGTGSDSDDEDNFHAHFDEEDENQYEDNETEDDWEGSSDVPSNADTDHGPNANELALSPDTPSSVPMCTCPDTSYPATADDLGDNGRTVLYQQRKLWEKWVIGRCPEHSSA